MWKLVSGMSLILCLSASADEHSPKQSVSVKCSGRLRDGIIAVGGETTGTTISFRRITWELALRDDAQQEFAREHHGEPVLVTGTLTRKPGIEVRERWIVHVRTLAECKAAAEKSGAQLTIRGILRATDLRSSDSRSTTIVADGQIWPIDVTADATLQAKAESLAGQLVHLTGNLDRSTENEQVTDEDSDEPLIIRVKTLQRSADVPVEKHRD